MNAPVLSVIIAVRNGVATLDRCLDSVLEQTDRNLEIVVMDGGSTDGTVDLLGQRRDSRLSWHSEPDAGISDAWNKGLRRATGEWVYFLGADDYLWSPEVLARVRQNLAPLPKATTVAYGRVAMVSAMGTVLDILGDPWERAGRRFRQLMSIPHQAAFHRATLFSDRGLFDLRFKIAGDYELLLRELKDGQAAYIPDVIVAGMGYGGLSSQPENAFSCLLEIRRAQRKNGIRWPGALWVFTLLKAMGRIVIFRLLGRRIGGWLVDFGKLVRGKERFWTKTL
jgi:glycosyltransferase involved in cell wall biosynthesis